MKPDSKWLAFYPLLFAVHPVLHIYANNYAEVRPSDILRPGIAALALGLIVIVVARLILRDPVKAGILASATIVSLISFRYGVVGARKIASKLLGIDLSQYLVAEHTIPALAALLIILAVALMRSRRKLRTAQQFVGVLALAMVLMSSGRLAVRAVGSYTGQGPWQATLVAEQDAARRLTRPEPMPDIYYIILDAYPRADILKRNFGFDNSEFIDYLKTRGFAVPSGSRSNYYRTAFSLGSSLNYDYLDAVAEQSATDIDREPFRQIANNKISWVMRGLGYRNVFLPSGWNVSAHSPCVDIMLPEGGPAVSELERIMVSQSILHSWWDRAADQRVRSYVLAQFEALKTVPRIDEPTFTFAHIMCPHLPIIFDRKGRFPNRRPTDALFVAQIEYLNLLVKDLVEELLAKSKTPPVIIIQADHGMSAPLHRGGDWLSPSAAKWSDDEVTSQFRDQVCILNAYYFPGLDLEIPDTITPVNTFRILLNEYFQGQYEILEDVTYIPTAGTWGDTALPSNFRRLDQPETPPAPGGNNNRDGAARQIQR